MAAADDIGACFDACAAYLGRTVTYSRGTESASVTACPGRQPVGLDMMESVGVLGVMRQWYAKASALSAFTRPAVGDTIVDGSETYTVSEADDGPCFDFADHASTIWRIYTKRTA